MMSELTVELWPLDRLKPYERNPRINDHAVDAVATSIREFGFRRPIVVDADGVIVSGHTRWKAAAQLGLALVPVMVAADLTPEQVRAYRIADNKTGELADWDPDLLPIELVELRDGGFELESLGFTGGEIDGLMATLQQQLADPDEIPEPPDAASTQRGDLWILGNHRLLCGDSAAGEDVDRLLGDDTFVHLVNTDPPYNVNVRPRGGGKKQRPRDRQLLNDHVSDEAFAELLQHWFGNIGRVLMPGGAFYIWGGYSNLENYPPAMRAAGLYFSQAIIWHKLHATLSRTDFMINHEWCFYGWTGGADQPARARGWRHGQADRIIRDDFERDHQPVFYGWRLGQAHRWFGPSNVQDVWPVKKLSPQGMVHLTEKPVELAARALQYSSQPGERVLDLFGGSGSTLIACEQHGRHARLMELDPLYCDVIVQRWEQFTGRKAERRSV